MNTQLASKLELRTRRSARSVAVSMLGPLTALAGLVWAVLQPYRVTLLDPSGHGFWALVIEPPLYVLAVGLAFHLLIAPGVLADLDEGEEA